LGLPDLVPQLNFSSIEYTATYYHQKSAWKNLVGDEDIIVRERLFVHEPYMINKSRENTAADALTGWTNVRDISFSPILD
jgi:hypothetical protein